MATIDFDGHIAQIAAERQYDREYQIEMIAQKGINVKYMTDAELETIEDPFGDDSSIFGSASIKENKMIKRFAIELRELSQDKMQKEMIRKELILESNRKGRWTCEDECVNLLIEIYMLKSKINHGYYKQESAWLETFKMICIEKGKISEDEIKIVN